MISLADRNHLSQPIQLLGPRHKPSSPTLLPKGRREKGHLNTRVRFSSGLLEKLRCPPRPYDSLHFPRPATRTSFFLSLPFWLGAERRLASGSKPFRNLRSSSSFLSCTNLANTFKAVRTVSGSGVSNLLMKILGCEVGTVFSVSKLSSS